MSKYGSRSGALDGKETVLITKAKNYRLTKEERKKLSTLSDRMFRADEKKQAVNKKQINTIKLIKGVD